MLSYLSRVPLAQLDRASGYGPEGLGFESSMARRRVATVVAAPFFVFPSVIGHGMRTSWCGTIIVFIDLGTLFVEKEKSKGKGGEI